MGTERRETIDEIAEELKTRMDSCEIYGNFVDIDNTNDLIVCAYWLGRTDSAKTKDIYTKYDGTKKEMIK
jgi:hypothetical protein